MSKNNILNPFKDELTLNVLRQLENNPEQSQRFLSKKLNVSLGSINYCLKSLVEVGFVKLNNFAKSNNKISYAYVLTPEGVVAKSKIIAEFLKRKQSEYEKLKREIDQLENELRS